jgi:hypothetical protein
MLRSFWKAALVSLAAYAAAAPVIRPVARPPGEDAVERGEYLTHEQAGQRLQRFLQS